MGAVLTTASMIKCPHPNGTLIVTGDAALTVGRQAVVPEPQVAAAQIGGCLNASSNTSPCQKIVPPVGGASVVLTVNGQPVMTDGLTAATDGIPQGSSLSAAAQQTALTAS